MYTLNGSRYGIRRDTSPWVPELQGEAPNARQNSFQPEGRVQKKQSNLSARPTPLEGFAMTLLLAVLEPCLDLLPKMFEFFDCRGQVALLDSTDDDVGQILSNVCLPEDSTQQIEHPGEHLWSQPEPKHVQCIRRKSAVWQSELGEGVVVWVQVVLVKESPILGSVSNCRKATISF